MKNLEKLAISFSKKLINERPYAKEEIEIILKEAIETISKNSDKSFIELNHLMIKDTLLELKKSSDKGYSVPLPGMTVGLNVNDSNIKLITGKENYNGQELDSNSLFDIASMTKLYVII